MTCTEFKKRKNKTRESTKNSILTRLVFNSKKQDNGFLRLYLKIRLYLNNILIFELCFVKIKSLNIIF